MTTKHFPEVEFKVLEIKRKEIRVGFRIVGGTGGWSESGWLITSDTVRVRWPDGFDWEPPIQIIDLLYPTSD